MCEIVFEDPEGKKEKEYVYQNSWGLSTRSIGLMIMVQGDDKGLRVPPRAASVQVVFVPIPKGENLTQLADKSKELIKVLSATGVRCHLDDRQYKPGWKYNFWETRGIPIRVEIGDRDIANESVIICRRDNFEKIKVSWADLATTVNATLDSIQQNLFDSAKKIKEERTKVAHTFPQFLEHLNNKNIVLLPFCLSETCEDNIKKRSREESLQSAQQSDETFGLTGAAKSLCIPFEQPSLATGTKCFGDCGNDAKSWCLFGRSY